MAANVTPVVLAIDGFAEREVMMVDYKFDQATDKEGQISGIPRGGKVTIRVKANCYCIHYVEKWEDGQQHFEEIEIVCQKLENGPVGFDNPWK